MSCINFMFAKSILRPLIVTLITSILDAFMFNLNMPCQIILPISLIFTLTTCILDTFMFRLNMLRQITLLCSLIVTLITSILDTFMF